MRNNLLKIRNRDLRFTIEEDKIKKKQILNFGKKIY